MSSTGVTFMVVRNATNTAHTYITLQWRENILTAAGCKLNSIWECAWHEIKKHMSNIKRKQ